jgi:hypothetical protein
MIASKETAREVLCGPVIPVVTHYNVDLSLDLGALAANVEYLIRAGVRTGDGCLLAAAAGDDFPMLSLAERKAVIECVARVAAGRVPVIAGAQATPTLGFPEHLDQCPVTISWFNSCGLNRAAIGLNVYTIAG